MFSCGYALSGDMCVHRLIHPPLNHSRSQSRPLRTALTIYSRNDSLPKRFTPAIDQSRNESLLLPQRITPAPFRCRNESLPCARSRTPAPRPSDALGRRTALLARDWPRLAGRHPLPRQGVPGVAPLPRSLLHSSRFGRLGRSLHNWGLWCRQYAAAPVPCAGFDVGRSTLLARLRLLRTFGEAVSATC